MRDPAEIGMDSDDWSAQEWADYTRARVLVRGGSVSAPPEEQARALALVPEIEARDLATYGAPEVQPSMAERPVRGRPT